MWKYLRPLGLALVLCASLNAQAQYQPPECNPSFGMLSVSPQMLQFNNPGQSFVSALYQDNLVTLLERSRQWTLCQSRDLGEPARLLALTAQAFLSFRLQYANAYVLHEYAHAEVGSQLQFTDVRVGVKEGNSIVSAPYLSNLATMAFDPRQIADISRRGVSVDWTGSRATTARESAQINAAGLNLNTYLAWRDFEFMLRGDSTPSRAMAYSVNKWFSPVYFEMDQRIGGDPSSYVSDLAAQGIATSKGEIQRVQLLAALMSNGMWTSLRALRVYGEPSDPTSTVARAERFYDELPTDIDLTAGKWVGPFQWPIDLPVIDRRALVYWPEFSTYLNQRGVSLGGEFGMQVDGIGALMLGLERNTIGQDQGTDLSLGYSNNWGWTSITTRITLNQGNTFFSFRGDYPLNARLSLTGLVYGAEGETLVGQRLAFRSKKGGYVGLQVFY